MPATEQPWRNVKTMHVIFGVASLAMLITTVWMLVDDHFGRPWRQYARQGQAIDVWLARHQQYALQTRDYFTQHDRLQSELAEATRQPLDAAQLTQFRALLEQNASDTKVPPDLKDFDEAAAAHQDAVTSGDPQRIDDTRRQLLEEMHSQIATVKSREDITDRVRKEASAVFDAERSKYDEAVSHGESVETIARVQVRVDRAKDRVDELVSQVEQDEALRAGLERIVGQLTESEVKLREAIATHRVDFSRFQKTIDSLSDNVGKRIIGGPILDAFDTSGVEIRQLWLPDLTVDFVLRDVARFDRCITCHRSMMDHTPEQGYAHSHIFPVTLHTPENRPTSAENDALKERIDERVLRIDALHGMMLSQGGPVSKSDVAVSFALPFSPAAQAGLKTGDVIERIDDVQVLNLGVAMTYLDDAAKLGGSLELTVRRGLPHPFAAHPRPDLYGTSASPHPFENVGCTICHDGQGSATSFDQATHSPNSEAQRRDWIRDDGWFYNHFWPYQMAPRRFNESTCLKCHHEVVELAPSERFPDPPAPKLMAGYNLIRRRGCFGCHEIQGFDGPNRRVGPDLRLEPNYFAAGLQLSATLPTTDSLVAQKEQLLAKLPPLKQREDDLDARDDALRKEVDSPLKKLKKGAASILQDAAQKKDAADDTKAGDGKDRKDVSARRAELIAAWNEVRPALEKLAPDLLPAPVPADDPVRFAAEVAAEEGWLADLLVKIATRRDGWKSQIEVLRKQQASINVDVAALDLRLHELEEMLNLSPRVGAHPEEDGPRRRLYELVMKDKRRPEEDKYGKSLQDEHYALGELLADTDTPGAYRKVGPSLRHVGTKLDLNFLLDWISNPNHFRPTTRMPRFFGLDKHLAGESKELTRRYDEVETRAVAYYLLQQSQPFEMAALPPEASAERGKELFHVRGCLACHTHQDFPQFTADQGPDLSRMGAKLTTPGGRDWLYNWLLDPARYHSRTLMPKVFVGPEDQTDGTNPAADIAAYLLSGTDGEFRPAFGSENPPPLADPAQPATSDAPFIKGLDELVMIHLSKALRSKRQAEKYLNDGSANIAAMFRGDEVALKGLTKENALTKKLDYVGRRTISRFACYACHDIPGFETAKPIATGLADWGRKDVSKLAFEQIAGYVAHERPTVHGKSHQGHEEHGGQDDDSGHGQDSDDPHLAAKVAAGEEFYYRGLTDHHHPRRESFIWQKLHEPRSFDYKKTENKPYLDRLRMPQFNFTNEEIEQVMTFVLGLVSEPPADQYLYRPLGNQRTIVEGAFVINKFNCAGCHPMTTERWEVTYDPGRYPDPGPLTDYPIFGHRFSDEQVRQSRTPDADGRLRTTLFGRPLRDMQTGEIQWFDREEQLLPRKNPDNLEVNYKIKLWRDALLDGHVYYADGQEILVPRKDVLRRPAQGGDLARKLFPHVLAKNPTYRTAAKSPEAWGWLPPPLVGEGRKVQTDWLHGFLLNPHRIRPAAVLRMPKFNMSAEEATKIVNYFAAVDNVSYPYQAGERTQIEHLQRAEHNYVERLRDDLGDQPFQQYLQANAPFYGNPSGGSGDVRLGDAMRLVTSRKFCTQCHYVGDFDPQGDPGAKGPNLTDVHRRLRPEFLLKWISNPKRMLPYTGMPVNFGPAETKAQDLYRGTSPQQIDAIVDLLTNFDRYVKNKTQWAPLVPKPEAPAKEAAAAAGDAGSEVQNE